MVAENRKCRRKIKPGMFCFLEKRLMEKIRINTVCTATRGRHARFNRKSLRFAF